MPPIVLTTTGISVLYRLFKSALENSLQQPFGETYIMMGYGHYAYISKAL